MATAPQLEVRVGWASERGPRAQNEDYAGAWLGSAAQRARLGVVAAVADGVAGAPGGRVAAETAVRGFLDAYLGQKPSRGIGPAAATALQAVAGWIHAQGRADAALAGMATTFTALILRGRRAHLLHVGDTRAWRLRQGRLARLTTDHVHAGPDRAHVLRRAVGLEDTVRADTDVLPLEERDRLALTTDGVHGALRAATIARLLLEEATPEAAARALVRAALDAGGADNATALVLDVVALPPPELDALAAEAAALPVLPPPRPGETVDGFRVGEPIADGRCTRLFRGEDPADGRPLVLKFPKPEAAADALFRAAFVREGWIGARVRSPWLGEVLELPPGRQSRLYLVMPRYAGETLEQRLARPPRVGLDEAVAIGAGLAKALAALHRAGVVHRDVKPENVVLAPGQGPRLIDLGVVRLPGLEEDAASSAVSGAVPGTPSYMAPELLAGAAGDARSDLFALGVTLYRLLTGAYPYGEVEPFQRKRFKAPTPLQARRPDLPAWLDLTLARAVAVDPAMRHGDALELALELEAGAARPVPPPRPTPLAARDPVRFWQAVAAALLGLLLASLALRG